MPELTKAEYSAKRKRLIVSATSEFGQNDELAVEGFGAMVWGKQLQSRVLIVRKLAPDQVPATITVNGLYGSSMAEVILVP